MTNPSKESTQMTNINATGRPARSTVRIVVGILLLITLLFIPTGVAVLRRHRNTVPILLVNLFLGWSFLGWLVALVWSFTDNTAGARQEMLRSRDH